MKDIQVTIYDIVGYFIPGVIATVGISLIFWTFLVSTDIDFDHLPSWSWIIGVFVSYIVGHLVQALANLLFKSASANFAPKSERNSVFTAALLSKANEVARALLSIPKEVELAPGGLYEICDAFLLQKGKTETRDVYVYREGFYRGLAVAFFFLAIGFSLRIACLKSTAHAGNISFEATKPQFAGMSVLSVCAASLSFRRFQRFQRYLVANSLIGAIVLYHDTDKSDKVAQT